MDNEESPGENFKELCSGYVLNTLNKNDRKEFERLLSEATEEQERLYLELSSAANQLAFTIEESEPSELLKEQLLHRVQADTAAADGREEAQREDEEAGKGQASPVAPPREEDEPFNWTSFSAAAAFALLIVSLSLLFYSFSLSSQINDQESFIEEQQVDIAELEEELQQKEEMLSILESPNIDLVLMNGLEVNPEGFGKVIWDTENRRALLQVTNLPPLSGDNDYQLWIIRDNEPISAGIFTVTDSTDRFFHMEEMAAADAQSANAFAITMEPKGGMPQPTGDMYLLGDMNGSAEN